MSDIDLLKEICKNNNHKMKEIHDILKKIDKLESTLERRLNKLNDHIKFVNDTYNSSIDQYFIICKNL
jgi:predicted nuclease with TOPRIM domain